MRNVFRVYLQFLLAIVLLAGNSCQRNVADPPPDQPPPDPLAEKVTASVRGRVLDENGKPVNNANIKSGTNSTTTDINGFFQFNNIQFAKNAGFVLVEKTGYLKGSRTFFTNSGVVNNVEIQLIPKVNRGSFTASAGGNITIENGSSVNFPANSIINTVTNTAYSGTVTVIGAYLDPTDAGLSSIMPGNLTGLTTNNEQKALQTFGMIAVELEGSGGEKLNLASGKTATINMPIAASLLAAAPATIPLWFFDETKGLWIEEGSATKTGSNYIGTVAHFSFWNCDVPANFITLKMILKNQAGQSLQGHKVEVINTQNNASAYGYTDSSGMVTGAVPNNANLQIKVYNYCGAVIHTQNAGPYAVNTDLGTVTVNIPQNFIVTINGSLRNCSNAAVTNGFAEVRIDGMTFRVLVNGNGDYSITIPRCNGNNTDAIITGTDLQTAQQGVDTLVIPISSGVHSAPELRACGVAVTEYVNYIIDGLGVVNYIPPADSVLAFRNGTSTFVYLDSKGSADRRYSSFNFAGPAAPGTYSLSNFYLQKNDTMYIKSGALNVTITEYGNPGQFIAGNFSGNMKDSLGSLTYPIECNFRVKRMQ